MRIRRRDGWLRQPVFEHKSNGQGGHAGRRVVPARIRKILWTCAAFLLVAPLTGGQAMAQAILEEIVITAEFREARAQDTPIAITAVSGNMLNARSQSTIYEVTRQSPNVLLTPADQAEGKGMIAFIRGIGQTDFNFALEPGVGVYVDDVYYPTLIGSLIELVDVERVEIMRGPQGTLAGRNSIGGAIKLFSQKPSGEGGGFVELTTGSYERIDVRGMANFTLAENLFVRIAGISRNRDGYVDRMDYKCMHPESGVPTFNTGDGCKLGTLGGESLAGGRLMLRWIPSNDLEVLLIGDLTNDSSEAGAQVLTFADHPGTTADGVPFLRSTIDGTAIPNDCRFVPFGENSCDPANPNDPYMTYATFLDPREPTGQAPFKPVSIPIINQIDDYGLSGTIDWTISPNFSLKSITAWREYQNSWGSNVTGSPVPVRMLRHTIKHHQWSEEIRLNGTMMDGFMDFTVGGFWFEQGGTLEARVDLNYAGIDFIHGPDTTPSTSKAVFGHVTFHATERLNISGGLRYSRDEKTYTYFRRNPDHTVPGPCPGPPPIDQQGYPPNCGLAGLFDISDTFKGDRLDWRAVADYRWSDQFMTYAQVATGYKSGGVNPRPFFGPSLGPCDPEGPPIPCNQLHAFEPETLRSYEIGFKSDLLENRARLNVSAFFNEYNDIILTLTACPHPELPCLQPRNIGAADVKGIEVEAQLQPVENLSLDGSVSYLDFDYTETDVNRTSITQDMVTPYTPEWKWSVGAQYDFYLPKGGMLSARFDGSYQSHIFSEPINTSFSRIDGYFLADARLTWRSPDEEWMVALAVENVTDKLYYLSQEEEHTQGSSAHVSQSPGIPRTWAVTVKRNF